jgi:hypothetical protein
MFRYIFENISNTIYSILYSKYDKILVELVINIEKNINLVKSYNLLKSKYHTYYDLYIELFNDNHKNTIEYNNLVDSYNNLQEKYDSVISENKNLKRKLLTNNNSRYIRKKLY